MFIAQLNDIKQLFINSKMVYYGENICQGETKNGKKCANFAYYIKNDKILCGVHCRKDRIKLPVNPNKNKIEEEQLEAEYKCIENIALKNKKNGKKGEVIVTKLKMMKKPEDVKGYLKIFPNYKHQSRKDGFGCSSLSPKSLGPIDHGMSNLPIAKNLENYHQFAKIFSFEKDDVLTKRIEGYSSNIPQRHKYDRKMLLKHGKNVNIPLYSIYYDKDEKEHRYSYLECRYFYCHWYEKLAPETQDFKKLIEMINDGYNLQIIGYDGYNIVDTLVNHYIDISKPFGHELVLYSLLVCNNPSEYPWNIYYENNKKIYENVI